MILIYKKLWIKSVNMQEISLNLQPSRAFTVTILLLILSSILIIVSLPIWSVWKILLIILTITYGAYTVCRYGLLKHSKAITRLILDPEECHLTDGNNVFPAQITGESVITSFVCLLRYKTSGSRWQHSLVICKDMLAASDYRRLLVWLRCK